MGSQPVPRMALATRPQLDSRHPLAFASENEGCALIHESIIGFQWPRHVQGCALGGPPTNVPSAGHPPI
eukprot:3027082-Alexandrium_andersonii.AAC.1